MYSVTIAHPVHIIIGTDSGTYQSPSSNRLFWGKRKRLMLLVSVYYSPARLRKKHNAFGTGSRIIFHFLLKEGQRIDIIVRIRLKHIQMQVWPERITSITTQSDHLPCLHRIFTRFGSNLHFP